MSSDEGELEIELDLSSFQDGPDGISPGVLQSILNSAAGGDDDGTALLPTPASSSGGGVSKVGLPRSTLHERMPRDPRPSIVSASGLSNISNGGSLEVRWDIVDSDGGDSGRYRERERDRAGTRSIASSARLSPFPTREEERSAEDLAECTFQPKLSAVRLGGGEARPRVFPRRVGVGAVARYRIMRRGH